MLTLVRYVTVNMEASILTLRLTTMLHGCLLHTDPVDLVNSSVQPSKTNPIRYHLTPWDMMELFQLPQATSRNNTNRSNPQYVFFWDPSPH